MTRPPPPDPGSVPELPSVPDPGLPGASAGPAAPVPAATVVLLRRGADRPEVLLTRRPASMAFAADMDVFPGGRVDPGDADARLADRSARSAGDAARALGGNVAPDEALALHHAAIRELFEEAGVLLADDAPDTDRLAAARTRLLAGTGLADAFTEPGEDRVAGPHLRTDRLAPIAHWTTPAFMDRRFSTWFFVADLPAGCEPSFVGDEVAEHRWVTPIAALDQLAAGETRMWVPTSSVLQRLIETGASSAAELGDRLAVGTAEPPRIVESRRTTIRWVFGAAGALPGRTGETALIGSRELVLVDPGDPSDAAIEAIAGAVRDRGGDIRAIVLTAPDPDHAAGAEALAIPLRIPILVAPAAGRHLPYAVRELADGERLPSDGDVRVRLGPPGSGRLEIVGGGG